MFHTDDFGGTVFRNEFFFVATNDESEKKEYEAFEKLMRGEYEVPRIAQVFGLDTGVKVNMTSVMHTTTTAVNLTKTLAKK